MGVREGGMSIDNYIADLLFIYYSIGSIATQNIDFKLDSKI